MKLLADAIAADPVIDSQFPAPRVVEAMDDVINLDVPFTLELPALHSNAYSDVLLLFVNTDGSNSPQLVVHQQAVSDLPTQGMVDNNSLSPPFDRDQSAVVRCFLRFRATGLWHRTPDSVHYMF